MRRTQAPILTGIACLTFGVGAAVTGLGQAPSVPLTLIVVGAVLLAAGVLRKLGQPEVETPARRAHRQPIIRRVALALTVLSLVTVGVALIVPIGEARGHAFIHLLTGLVCLALFAALAFPWRPAPGTSGAAVRSLVLALLVVATLGSFLESMGGAGYDAANDARRIPALTLLHDIALPFSAFAIVALPLAVITGVVVVLSRVIAGRRALDA